MKFDSNGPPVDIVIHPLKNDLGADLPVSILPLELLITLYHWAVVDVSVWHLMRLNG